MKRLFIEFIEFGRSILDPHDLMCSMSREQQSLKGLGLNPKPLKVCRKITALQSQRKRVEKLRDLLSKAGAFWEGPQLKVLNIFID